MAEGDVADNASDFSLVQVPREVRIQDPFATVKLGEQMQSMPLGHSFRHKLDRSKS